MAINPLISLGVKSVDLGAPAQNFITNLQNVRQSTQQSQANKLAMQWATLKQLATMAPAVSQAAQAGDINGLTQLAGMMPPQAQQEMMQMINLGDYSGIDAQAQRLAALGTQLGLSTTPAGVREFETMTQGLTPEQKQQARLVNLGIAPRAGMSAQERIATDPNLGQRVVEQVAAEAGASEGAKLGEQAKRLPNIRAAIKTAEQQAESRGEALSELSRAEVAMPGLQEVVSSLKELAPVATATFGGRVFDMAAKELGFGATKGSTARAKYTAIIDNQILPLLKQTFGAAFTAVEGERLRATLGDPNAAPGEKIAQLDAFIDSKMRELRTKQARVDQTAPKAAAEMSDDELLGNF